MWGLKSWETLRYLHLYLVYEYIEWGSRSELQGTKINHRRYTYPAFFDTLVSHFHLFFCVFFCLNHVMRWALFQIVQLFCFVWLICSLFLMSPLSVAIYHLNFLENFYVSGTSVPFSVLLRSSLVFNIQVCLVTQCSFQVFTQVRVWFV